MNKSRKKFLILTACLLVLGAAGAFVMGDLYVSGKWRYKITVVVETPEGIKTGSAVREISNSASSIQLDLPEGGNPAEIKGEAVVVDLGERGVLFSLIGDDARQRFYSAFGKVSGATTAEGIRYFNSLPVGAKAVLDPQNFPKMVVFTDLSDPKSVMLVYAPRRREKPIDNVEGVFGEGVTIKEVVFEITTEPVTWGMVDKYLPAEARNLNMTYSHFNWPNEAR